MESIIRAQVMVINRICLVFHTIVNSLFSDRKPMYFPDLFWYRLLITITTHVGSLNCRPSPVELQLPHAVRTAAHEVRGVRQSCSTLTYSKKFCRLQIKKAFLTFFSGNSFIYTELAMSSRTDSVQMEALNLCICVIV